MNAKPETSPNVSIRDALRSHRPHITEATVALGLSPDIPGETHRPAPSPAQPPTLAAVQSPPEALSLEGPKGETWVYRSTVQTSYIRSSPPSTFDPSSSSAERSASLGNLLRLMNSPSSYSGPTVNHTMSSLMNRGYRCLEPFDRATYQSLLPGNRTGFEVALCPRGETRSPFSRFTDSQPRGNTSVVSPARLGPPKGRSDVRT